MLARTHDLNSKGATVSRSFYRSNVASDAAAPAFLYTTESTRANGAAESYADLRRIATKYVVRDAIGYGRCPEGKRLVVACAWNVAPQFLDRLLSPSHPMRIGRERIALIPSPQREQIEAMERAFDAMSIAALAAWVAEKRASVGAKRVA